MTSEAQGRALANHRRRLSERGMSRYEVRGLAADIEIVRGFAKRLAKDDATAAQLRATVARKLAGHASSLGRVLAALRRSPLVGLDWHIDRATEPGRDIDL